MSRLLAVLLVLSLFAVSASAQLAVASAGVSTLGLASAGSWLNYSFPIPASYSSGQYDVVIIGRANPFASTNPSNAEVDLYVTVSGSSLSYVSANTGADAVMVNSRLPSAGLNSTAEGLSLGGPLPVSAAGTATLNIGVYVRAGSAPVNTSLTITYAARIQYDWTQPSNTYSGVLAFDQVQIFEYAIPFPQPGGCSNGVANCSEGHIGFFSTPSAVDSLRRGVLLGTYPSISGNPSMIPFHPSTYDRSSDVSNIPLAGEMITSNDQDCYGTAPYDPSRCVWRMMVWAKYAALPSYTFRAQVVDISTVVDNKSGDHQLLTVDAGPTAPRSIAAAEMQYWVFYATQPNTTYTLTCQSINPGPGGTNVDLFVQSIAYSSLPHPDANGYSWESALDMVSGVDSVVVSTPGTYGTPYNYTVWVAAFGQRAGTYTLTLQHLVSATAGVASPTPIVAGQSAFATVSPGYWQYYSYLVPSSYQDGLHDIVMVGRQALGFTTAAEVDLYVTSTTSSQGYHFVSANTGGDAVIVNTATTGIRSSATAADSLYLSGPLPTSAANTVTLLIGLYVSSAAAQPVNTSLTITYAARIQYDWTQPSNTYSGVLAFDQVQIFEYAIPFPQPGGCSNGVANCSEGHIGFFSTPSAVDSLRRGVLLGTYPSISGNPSMIPFHPSTYDRSSDVSNIPLAGEMITSNDQDCYGTAPYDPSRCVWRMMVWAKYAALPSYTFRAQVVDISTVVDNKSGDHQLLTVDAGPTAPRSIAAAEMQYWVFYATQPNTTYTLTCQSINPGPGGTNVDLFVQSIAYSSLPHPDANGYSWESALDMVSGVDSVVVSTPGTYGTPYNYTVWVAAFGQRAGTYTLTLQHLVSATAGVASPTPIVAGQSAFATVSPGYWQYYSYLVPSSYQDGLHDIVMVGRQALGFTTAAEVDLYVTSTTSSQGYHFVSANTGGDAVIVNTATTGIRSSATAADSLYLSGPLPTSAANTVTLLIGLYVSSAAAQPVNTSLTITYAARIQYDWTQPSNTYSGVLAFDQVQIFEYAIPFPQPGGCSNGVANCSEGHIGFFSTPSAVDSLRRGVLLGTYPSISGNPSMIPFHPSTYDRSSDVSNIPLAGEMITSNDQDCYGTAPYDPSRCVWRMMVWAKYAALPSYTFRAQVVDISTVVDNKSGDHQLLTVDAGPTAPRSIAAAEMQYWVFYATQPNTTYTLTCQSINPGPGGTNVDLFVQSIAYSSLPHPDANGYSWESALDMVSGVDSVVVSTPGTYGTPYNYTVWVAAFGQRAGTYTLTLQHLVSATAGVASPTPIVAGQSAFATVSPGYWQYYSYLVPSSYQDGLHDIVMVGRQALGFTTAAEVDLYVTSTTSSQGYHFVSANTGGDAVIVNTATTGIRSSATAADSLYLSGPLPTSAANTVTLLIGLYVSSAAAQPVNTSLTITYAARIQYDWTQPSNTYSGVLAFDQVQIFEYAIPFPQPGGCSNGVANCSEGHIGFFSTPSAVDSLRRGVLLGTYPSISGNPSMIPFHPSTYDRSSDVSNIPLAGEMITSNDQDCYGTAPYDPSRCVWRMMVWAKYAALPSYTFRAQVVDISTVVDNKSGDHQLLTVDAGPTAPRSIAAAEMQYWVFYATQPNTTYTLTCQSINPGPGGTNVDLFVQSIAYSSLPHPDANGYSWESAMDLQSGLDNVTLTSPGSYGSPYNYTVWVAAFGQRAGTYTLQLVSGKAASISGGSSGLSGGAIAGIVIGSVVGAAILLGVCMLLVLGCAGSSKSGKPGRRQQQAPAQRFEDASQIGSHAEPSQREVEMSQTTA